MTNKTVLAAIKIGFDFGVADFETKEEFEKSIIDFLHENSDKIKRSQSHFCEVTNSRNVQHVSFGNFESTGEIVRWSDYWGKRKQRIYHSNFVDFENDGTPILIKLYCYSK